MGEQCGLCRKASERVQILKMALDTPMHAYTHACTHAHTFYLMPV